MPGWIGNVGEEDVGEEWEKKLSIDQFGSLEEGTDVVLRPSSWKTPVRFHRAARSHWEHIPVGSPKNELSEKEIISRDSRIAAQIDCAAGSYLACCEAFEGIFSVPSIHCVHVVVTTSDGNVLVGKRSMESEYFPGAYALSFEEQVRVDDLDEGDAVLNTIRRGLREEFGVDVSEREITINGLSLGLEWPGVNAVMMAWVEIGLILGKDHLSGGDNELDVADLIPISESRNLVKRDNIGFLYSGTEMGMLGAPEDHCPELHPTSVARIGLLGGKEIN